MNIFEALRQDQDKQRTLAGELVATHGASDEREALFTDLRHELKDHAAAEERFFYAPLMPHDLAQDRAGHSVAEHHDIDELIGKLEDIELRSPQWLAVAKQLQESSHTSSGRGRARGIPDGGQGALSDNQKSILAKDYRRQMDGHD